MDAPRGNLKGEFLALAVLIQLAAVMATLQLSILASTLLSHFLIEKN